MGRAIGARVHHVPNFFFRYVLSGLPRSIAFIQNWKHAPVDGAHAEKIG